MIEEKKRTFVFDFDSTLTQVEAFEELAEISLKGDPKRKQKIEQIGKITDQGCGWRYHVHRIFGEKAKDLKYPKRSPRPIG